MYVSPETFEIELREALVNLYNPLYRPSADLCATLGCGSPDHAAPVQAALVDAIRQLCPGPHVPAEVPARRYYDLLLYRYVENLTQESAAERMGISPRYLRELQGQAVQALARKLWRGEGRLDVDPDARSIAADAPLSTMAPDTAQRPDDVSSLSQIEQELAALKKSAPNAQADLQESVQSAIKLARALPRKETITVESADTLPSLRVLIHPTALRQALLRAIEELANVTASGAIRIAYESIAGFALVVRLEAGAPADGRRPDVSLIEQIVTSYGGTVRVEVGEKQVIILMRLPTEGRNKIVRVLVVDDNDDLVAFYRAYTTGTPYEIAHIREGSQLLERVQQERPDIIVLDVMLPDHDMDGWELLVHLHEHPLTRSIPVVVCSVIRDESLALALGATLYVPKPVRRQQFINALDQAISRVS